MSTSVTEPSSIPDLTLAVVEHDTTTTVHLEEPLWAPGCRPKEPGGPRQSTTFLGLQPVLACCPKLNQCWYQGVSMIPSLPFLARSALAHFNFGPI